MTISTLDTVRPSLSLAVGPLVTTAVVTVAVAHAGYFAAHLPSLPPEALVQSGPAFTAVRAAVRALEDTLPLLSRGLSVLCLGLAVLATAWLGRKASGDAPAGAFFALGWVLFPPLTALHALATPHALLSALVAGGLACLWPSPQPDRRAFVGLGAVLLVIAALVGHEGAWAAAAAAVIALWLRPRLWTVLAPVLGAALAVLVTVPPLPMNMDLVVASDRPWLDGVLLPYAMVWVGALLGAVASRDRRLRSRMGGRMRAVCRAAPFMAAGLIFWIGGDASRLLSSGAFFFVMALLGALPLVIWVRTIMPTVRHLMAWLAFPVIMYSCFWVVLGPISPDRFPYNLLRPADSSGAALPDDAFSRPGRGGP